MGTRYDFGASDEDKLLLSRVEDAVVYAGKRYSEKFIGFLDKHQQAAANSLIMGPAARGECNVLFWGGYPDAERTLLGVFPPYEEPDTEKFPVAALRAEWKFQKLTHRDFLGAILGLGFRREKIGDILFSDQDSSCIILADRAVADYIAANLEKVGRTGVRVSFADFADIKRQDHFESIQDTIASSRIDCIVSALVSGSRSDAEKLIAGGQVSLNFETVYDHSKKVCDGVTVSIRGHGRFLVDKIGPQTRKGRFSFKARRYL